MKREYKEKKRVRGTILSEPKKKRNDKKPM